MKDITVKPDISIRQAMKTLSQLGEKCLVIVNEKNHLLGTLSDGDLRKAILNGAVMVEPIKNIYQKNSRMLVEGKYMINEVKQMFTENKFDLIPVVDARGKLTDILQWGSVLRDVDKNLKEKLNVPVVIMAGGKGSRMEPFTKILPKPLVPVHEKPIIEHIIERFRKVGCCDFHLTVNYKGRILKAYFEEQHSEYQLNFVEEKEPMGTAGSLCFLNGKFNQPFFVTNCDIIIKADYNSLYKFHQKGEYDVTLVASSKEFVIPYGTCELNDEGHLSHINEKPSYDFLINTGLYVLNPEMLKMIPEKKYYHITHLIENAKNMGKKIGVYPIGEDAWIDVGQWAEYQKAIEQL